MTERRISAASAVQRCLRNCDSHEQNGPDRAMRSGPFVTISATPSPAPATPASVPCLACTCFASATTSAVRTRAPDRASRGSLRAPEGHGRRRVHGRGSVRRCQSSEEVGAIAGALLAEELDAIHEGGARAGALKRLAVRTAAAAAGDAARLQRALQNDAQIRYHPPRSSRRAGGPSVLQANHATVRSQRP